MVFIDEAVLQAVGGHGGNGCMAFRREKFEPRGGPSGGDGGHGGSVYLCGDAGRNTLYHLRGHRRYAAQRGRHGEGSNKTGKSGSDLEVVVPLGTVAFDRDTGAGMGEVVEHGERLMVARGGRGGRGNARFKTATNRAPRRTESGREGQERWLRLELKLLADVGLVGLPNAGKSTLISTLSAARPKIAAYPFTTVVPNLGVVATGRFDEPFVIADLPGLIAGAAEGAGLGHRFLRHVERCSVLVHLVDLSTLEASSEHGDEHWDGRDAERDLALIEDELRAFDASLLARQRLVVGSKLDTANASRRATLRKAALARGLDYLEISALSARGLDALTGTLRQRIDRAIQERTTQESAAS